MSDRQGVEIDYCPECRGVWLDRGELDKIIARSDRDDDDDDDRREVRRDDRSFDREREQARGSYPQQTHRKKKKSFFSEIMEGFGGD